MGQRPKKGACLCHCAQRTRVEAAGHAWAQQTRTMTKASGHALGQQGGAPGLLHISADDGDGAPDAEVVTVVKARCRLGSRG